MVDLNGQLGLGRMLAGVLAAQRDLYAKLGELARRQTEYVASGQSEELMTVLGARARLIEELSPLDRQLQPYKGQWQRVLDGLAGAERVEVAGLLGEVQRLLADILAQDEADRQSLIRQKTDIGAQIGQAVTGARLNRAYGVRPRGPGVGMVG